MTDTFSSKMLAFPPEVKAIVNASYEGRSSSKVS